MHDCINQGKFREGKESDLQMEKSHLGAQLPAISVAGTRKPADTKQLICISGCVAATNNQSIDVSWIDDTVRFK